MMYKTFQCLPGKLQRGHTRLNIFTVNGYEESYSSMVTELVTRIVDYVAILPMAPGIQTQQQNRWRYLLQGLAFGCDNR